MVAGADLEKRIDRAGIRNVRVLEPSAGVGNIALEAVNLGARVQAFDIEPKYCADLRQQCLDRGIDHEDLHIICGDFMRRKPPSSPEDMFDVVMMNPPFTKGQDATHVLHAWDFLKPGGVLVAIVSAQSLNKSGKHYQRLFSLVSGHGVVKEKFEKGTFKKQGIMVETYMIVAWRV